MKTRYSRWKVVLGFIGFVLVMGIVGRIEQTPDIDSQQAALEEQISIRDQIQAATKKQDAVDRIYVAEMEKRGRGGK